MFFWFFFDFFWVFLVLSLCRQRAGWVRAPVGPRFILVFFPVPPLRAHRHGGSRRRVWTRASRTSTLVLRPTKARFSGNRSAAPYRW